jgi:hypothetical protein
MDYLLTVAEERHRSHLVSKSTDIRHSVKQSYQRYFTAAGKEEEPLENQEDFEIAPTLGVKGNTDNLYIRYKVSANKNCRLGRDDTTYS